MNCLYEACAELYLRVRGRFVPEADNELENAEESLEACRANLSVKERELAHHCQALGRAALAKRKEGDLAGARFHLQAGGPCFARGFFRGPATDPRRRRRSAAATWPGSSGCATASPWWTSSSTPSARASSTRS
jgi:hypothetical protein